MLSPGSVNIELEQIHYNLHNTKGYLFPTILFCRHNTPYKLIPLYFDSIFACAD